MSVELVVTAEAERDIAEAFSWYEEQRVGLGEELVTCLDASLQGIKRMHGIAYRKFRRALVRRFPYFRKSKMNELLSTVCFTQLASQRSGGDAFNNFKVIC